MEVLCVVSLVHLDVVGGDTSAAGEQSDRSEDDDELASLAVVGSPAVGGSHGSVVRDQ